ncbi:MAG: hypothetical protein J5449_13010, partial [Oscillospiraceae bacterium]|nr:hypothetical protein [Oscillospiraceae bacterium]
MDLKKRLLRKPATTVLWLVLAMTMAAFLTAAAALSISASRLASSLDENHTAIAVRTNRAVTQKVVNGKYEWETAKREFTQEDKDWLESLDSVRTVRIHALCGGTSPSFEPLLGLKRENSWRGSGDELAYHDAIFVGTVVSEGSNGGEFQIGFATEEILTIHPEYVPTLYTQNPEGINYLLLKSFNKQGSDTVAAYFREGERYIICGMVYTERDELTLGMKGSIFVPELYFWSPVEENGALICSRTDFPLAERLDGDAETFIASHPIWQEYRDTLV